jgi:hypothetical protein
MKETCQSFDYFLADIAKRETIRCLCSLIFVFYRKLQEAFIKIHMVFLIQILTELLT